MAIVFQQCLLGGWVGGWLVFCGCLLGVWLAGVLLVLVGCVGGWLVGVLWVHGWLVLGGWYFFQLFVLEGLIIVLS